MSTSAVVLESVDQLKVALHLVQTILALTAWQYPPSCSVTNGSYSDFIIVGSGSAGSILANRLSANFTTTVLEAGGYPPIESDYTGTFTALPRTQYDFNVTTVNDNYTAQNLVGQQVRIVQGKMMGGCSSLHHTIHTQGDRCDYDEWANITGDQSWSYANIVKYFRETENLLVRSLANSSYAAYHGTDGYLKLTKQPSSVNDNYFNALKELGIKIREDVSGELSLGVTEPLLTIANGIRQNTALAYLGGSVANRSNLCVSLYSTVTKIIFTNNTATGVEMVNSNGDKYVLYARKEVILSAGAINTPAILLRSGIGPKADLKALGIKVVADLPVGENYQDHPVALVAFQMESSNATTPASNPHEFPVPAHIGFVALDSAQTCPDYQAIGLHFPHEATAIIQIASIVFGYKNDICDAFFAATSGHNVYLAAIQVSKPKSRGKVSLNSTDYTVNPTVYTGVFNDSSDLKLLAKSLENYSQLLNTTYFKSVNASLVDVGVCSGSSNFWECYALEMSSAMNHGSGTCAMGSVVDSELRVKGINNLRVVDASAMPKILGNEINGGVIVIAERAAELILNEYS